MVITQDSWMKSKQWIIQDTMKTTVNVLIVGCLVLAGNITGQSIVEPPRDTTGLVGSSAKLSCKVTFGPTNDMMWEHNGAYIYSFMHGNEEYPYGQSKYEVTRSGSTFELEIKMLTFTDSGIIKCNSFNLKAEAVLIVIENPVLHIEPQDPVEGDSSAITCDASFGGPGKELISPDNFPKLELYLEGKPLPVAAIDEDKSIYKLHKVYNLTVEAGMNGDRITCMVQTPHPAFNATQSSIVKVLYNATNITYTPQLKQYEVGSSLTCTAQGNPPPVIEWENTAGKKFQGKQLQITESMVGPNRWKCTALNIISGRKHEESMIAEFSVVKDYDYESTSTDPVGDVAENENNSPKFLIIGLVLGIVGLAVGVLAFLFVMKRRHRTYVTTTDSEQRIGDTSNKDLKILEAIKVYEQNRKLFLKIPLQFIQNEPNDAQGVTEPLNSDEKEYRCKRKKENPKSPKKIASADKAIEMQLEPFKADEEGNQCEGKNENPFVDIEMQPEREPLTHNADECEEDQRKSKRRNSKSLKRNTSAEDIFLELQHGKKTLALTNERHSEV